jgi:membrane fusion protein (multidrug efflux system)
MKKRIALTIAGLLIVIAILGAIKGLQIRRMTAQGQFAPPPETVSTSVVKAESWESLLSSVGSLTAVQGVTVSAELSGKVVKIDFEPGMKVRADDLLVQQDISSEKAQLPGAEAAVALTKTNLKRAKELLAKKMISQADYDTALSNYKEALAKAETIRSIIGKKTIRAPFAGRLGIRLVNLGQILNEGDAIVSLQSLDPIFVDFSLPQQQLAEVQPGLTVRLTTNALPNEVVEGKITAINPEVDSTTRNVRLQATVENPQEKLRPGMFVNVSVVLPARKKLLVLPATAVLYAPYSDSVFVVEKKKGESNKPSPGLVLRQQFVRLGEKRGDFISVISGVKEGETVVNTGVFKLRNGQAVVVDNTLTPEFKLAPKPENN